MPISPARMSAQLPRTAEGIVAAELRGAIVRGDLAPGAKILQEATAEELGVSLIPMREALKTLAGEGIVTYRAQRGYFVAELPVERIRELYLAREVVEEQTERLAIPAIVTQDLEAMRGQLRIQERAVDERDPVEMIAANRTFHFTIFQRSGNAWLVRFAAQLWDALDPYRVLSYRRMWLEQDQQLLPQEILTEHERILGALEVEDAELALTLLCRHRERSKAFLAALTPTERVSSST
jgi:DNA-binding GntR family transcriptional regulator